MEVARPSTVPVGVPVSPALPCRAASLDGAARLRHVTESVRKLEDCGPFTIYDLRLSRRRPRVRVPSPVHPAKAPQRAHQARRRPPQGPCPRSVGRTARMASGSRREAPRSKVEVDSAESSHRPLLAHILRDRGRVLTL